MKTLITLLMLSATAFTNRLSAGGQSNTRERVYVWEFQSNLKDPELIDNITDEFETALQGTGRYSLLERRKLARLLSRRANEVTDMSNLGDTDSRLLKGQGAQAVFFGNVFNDPDSGSVRMTVTLESLSGTIELKKSVRMRPVELRDDKVRDEKYKELLGIATEEGKTPDDATPKPGAPKSVLNQLISGQWVVISRGGSDTLPLKFKSDSTCTPQIPNSEYAAAGGLVCRWTLRESTLKIVLAIGGMAMGGYTLERDTDNIFRGNEDVNGMSMGSAEMRRAN